MKDTCRKEGCYWWELCGDKCPDYIQTWWKAPDQEPVLITDCARIRTFLMIQELSNRLVGVEKSQEEMRNEAVWIQVVAEVLGRSSGVNLERFVEERKRRELIVDARIT
jgi:hypothetical protein